MQRYHTRPFRPEFPTHNGGTSTSAPAAEDTAMQDGSRGLCAQTLLTTRNPRCRPHCDPEPEQPLRLCLRLRLLAKPRPRPLRAPRKVAPPTAWRERVCSRAGAHASASSDQRVTLSFALNQTRSCPVGGSAVPGRRPLVGAQLERVTVVNLSKPIERTTPGTVHRNVKNGLWVSVMCQCLFIVNKCTTRLGGVDNGGRHACVGQGTSGKCLYLPLNVAVNLELP